DHAAVHAPRPCRVEPAGGDRRAGLALRAFPDLVLAAHRTAGRAGGRGQASCCHREGARAARPYRRGRRRLVRRKAHRRPPRPRPPRPARAAPPQARGEWGPAGGGVGPGGPGRRPPPRARLLGARVLTAARAPGGAEPVAVTAGITNVIADVGLFVADKRGYF